MRYLIIILFILALIQSCKKTDATDVQYHVIWTYPDEAQYRITEYHLFLYETTDTTISPFISAEGDTAMPENVRGYQIAVINADSIRQIYGDGDKYYYFMQSENGKFIQAAMSAFNGIESSLVVTGFTEKDFLITPKKPKSLIISK